MTDTAAARRRGAAGHHPARAPRRGVLLGPPLHDLERAGDRAPGRGQAEHRGLPAARRAARPRRSLLPRDRRGAASAPCSRTRAGCPRTSLRERGWVKVDLGQGPIPHAEGGFGTRDRPRRRCDAALRAVPRGGRRGAGGALPARAGHAEDAPVPQLDLRQPEAPARGPAAARGGDPPGRRRGRAASRTAPRCACSTTAARSRARRACRTTPAPACWWRRWAGGTRDYAGGRSGQATTSQRLTAAGNAPTFNDNRVECERLKAVRPLECPRLKGSDP